MPTFLVTSKMNPALRARVAASVRGRKDASRAPVVARRIVAIARVVLLLAAASAVYATVTKWTGARRELERSRAALLETVRARSAAVTPEDRDALLRAETWLMRLSGGADAVVLGEALPSRAMVYVRGSVSSFGSPEQIASAASASYKDAFLLCLLDPPSSRTEPELLAKVRAARAGGASVEARTANVRRLNDLVVGLPFLALTWSDRVRGAADVEELARLREDFEGAPIERAKQAARAEVLLAVMDEPGTGPAELDGERPHGVRVALVDLATAKLVLYVRKEVDPSWISPAKRPMYASDLDACALAYDLREDLRKAR